MSKKIKRLLATIGIGILVSGIFGCTKNGNDSKETLKSESKEFKEVKYTYSNNGQTYDVIVDKKIEKAVTLSQFMTEMLLALGLEDRMVGTALLDNPILPEFKESYEKVPVLPVGEGHDVSKESFIATGADFVSGWDSSISERSTGTPEELINTGIKPFLAKSYEWNATIDTVYEDFKLLGEIFNVEEKAEKVIGKMKKDIEGVSEKVRKIKEEDRVKMMVYDSGENDAYVVGSGLANDLIKLAGGNNVYGKDAKKPYIKVSFESIVSKNPEVILVTDYEVGGNPEEKIKFLKSHPALKDVEAIKNNRIYVVPLSDLSPGVRNPLVIDKMHSYFFREGN